MHAEGMGQTQICALEINNFINYILKKRYSKTRGNMCNAGKEKYEITKMWHDALRVNLTRFTSNESVETYLQNVQACGCGFRHSLK